MPAIYLSISIHALRGEGDAFGHFVSLINKSYFNPRPPWGGRQDWRRDGRGHTEFQSTPSVGRATVRLRCIALFTSFQSTPSVGRATICNIEPLAMLRHFNPRPPWGGRRRRNGVCAGRIHFNPRPPWGGRPDKAITDMADNSAFQSTPSVGRATKTKYRYLR